MSGQWTFPVIPANLVRRDPFEQGFFVGDDEGDGSAGPHALIRETVQNALDAGRANQGPTRVRFAIYEASVGQGVIDTYLTGLKPHLDACNVPWPARAAKMRWLVYEDFGTTGLEGDPGRTEDPAADGSDGPQSFYWFFRNIGRSGKSGQDLGRWGLGKSVLHASGPLNTIFGLTVRASDGRRLLMGQAVLRQHSLDGERRAPEGFFHGEPREDELPMPIEDAPFCDRFSEVFSLRRAPEETGLSVVVPFCKRDLMPEDVVRSLVTHWIVPILRGDLIAEIEGSGFRPVRITADSIHEIAGVIGWNSSSGGNAAGPQLSFVRWAIAQQSADSLHGLHHTGRGKSPKMTEDRFEACALAELRKKYTAGERLAVRVPMDLEMNDGSIVDTHFDAFLWRDPALARPRGDSGPRDLYVREGMTITKVHSLRSAHPCRGLVLIDDPELSAMLGDAEGPAHEFWKRGEACPNRRYKGWDSRMFFVKSSLAKLVEILTPPPEGLDRDLLSEMFNVLLASSSATGNKPDGIGETRPVGPGPINALPNWYRLSERVGGFRLSRSNDAPIPEGASLFITAAYDIPRGNPINNWSPFDFHFNRRKITIREEGVVYSIRQGNRLEVHPQSEDFKITATGFDTNRDLIIQIDEVLPDTLRNSDSGSADAGEPALSGMESES